MTDNKTGELVGGNGFLPKTHESVGSQVLDIVIKSAFGGKSLPTFDDLVLNTVSVNPTSGLPVETNKLKVEHDKLSR